MDFESRHITQEERAAALGGLTILSLRVALCTCGVRVRSKLRKKRGQID
jgi:hypothetical protein